ncbi:MAG: penicillin-binding protein 2 [Patescibacteria group bacterium]|nr:penicillin-binding protein 2 [Patescibacteria group bacterium]
MNKNEYSQKADRQYFSIAKDVFNRGSIFFSKKDGSLVAAGTVMSGFKLAINPSKIEDIEATYNALNEIIEINYDDFIYRASKINDPYEDIANRLSKEIADKISGLDLPGVSIYSNDKWRFYPGSNLAAHPLGFVAFRGDELRGQYGLERQYNSILSKQGDEVYINFFAEIFSNLRKVFKNRRTGDIITTIEPVTQQMLEVELKTALERWKAESAGGIIINPQNGEIYAMSSLPDFNLNKFNKVSDPKLYGNPFIENVFEFGSVIKPLVMAAALDQGAVTAETEYYDHGLVQVEDKVINNFDKKGRGKTNMQGVLSESLNTGMVFVEQQMGNDSFRKYMKAYGIGEKTNIDLPNETKGLISNLDSPRDLEYATASFGQGIALTPIGAVRAFSSIANGGNLIIPHLVKKIKYDDGSSDNIIIEPIQAGIIKKESSEEITRMLVSVFDNSYYQGKYKFDRYSVATKTGTAQVAKEAGRGYYEDQHMHSFFGYFPAYDPEFLVFLYLKNPQGIKYASQTLISPFVDITKFILNYYAVAPDR